MKDRAINVSLRDSMGKVLQFTTIKSLKKFLHDELQYWSAARKNFSAHGNNLGEFSSAVDQLNQIHKGIEKLEPQLDAWDDSAVQQHIHQTVSNFSQHLTSRWLWSGHPYCHAWLEAYEKYGHEIADSFIDTFIRKGRLSNLNNANQLAGLILGYEFRLQDESTLTKRRNSESKSIHQLRDRLIESQNKLFEEVSQFKSDFSEWDEGTRSFLEKHYNVRKKLGERQLRQQKNRFSNQVSEWQQNIANLETTYQEKLRLEKPAKYWGNKAKSYFFQGTVWASILGLTLLLGLLGFGWLFKNWISGLDANVDLSSIQGVIIFVTLLSVYAFTIRTLSKLTFSAYHLQRDAEEREQLTHVYLALTNEKDDIDEEARKVVLQSLFSRADTGLLGGDSGPTMPGLNEIVRAGSR